MRHVVAYDGPEALSTDDELMLHDIGGQCARCGYEFTPRGYCADCSLNLFHYTTEQRAMLVYLYQSNQERLRTQPRPRTRTSELVGAAVPYVLLLFVLFFIFGGVRLLFGEEVVPTPEQVYVESYAIRMISSSPAYINKDYTGDGILNCQDYTYAFIIAYIEKLLGPRGITGSREALVPDRLRIIVNSRMGPTGHMFAAVRTTVGWMYIETQPGTKYLTMEEQWGYEYTSVARFNEDASDRFWPMIDKHIQEKEKADDNSRSN